MPASIDRAHDGGAYAVADGDELLGTDEHPAFKYGEDGSDDGEGDEGGDENGAQRGDEEVDHFGHMLVQPFFDRAHQQYRQDYRDDVALIADLLYLKEEQVPDGDLAGGVVADGPGVDERGVDHHDADDGAEENVAAEDAGGGDGDQNRQQSERGVRNQVQEGEPVALAEGGPEFRDGFDNAHHQTGGHDGGQDGDEHVAGGLEDLLPQGHAGGCGGLDIGL